MQTTTALDFGADCNKNSKTPVIPDILIENNLHSKVYQEDNVLQYLLGQIK